MSTAISPERAERIRRLLGELKEMQGPERAEWLDEVRASDADLGRELEALLTIAEEQTGETLENLDQLLRMQTTSVDTDADLTRRTISHFRIIERLGSGGMGVVYRAEDIRLGRTVALKFLPRHLRLDEKARKRLVQEARAASQLDHPNVCTVYEVDQTADGRTFIAMACYEGETLKSLLEREGVELDEAIEYARQILLGLEAAHTVGIIHRDVKPANLFVLEDGTVKILDFGLAKLAAGDATVTGALMGTAAYMSPEQVRGEDVDRRTDLWSLGAVLYEMLTGRRPFAGAYELAVLYSVLHVEPDPLPDHIPDRIRRVVGQCLAKDRAERFHTAADVAEALTETGPRPSARPYVAWRRWMGAAAAISMLLFAVGLAWTPTGSTFVERVQTMVGVTNDVTSGRHIVVLPFSSYSADERKTAFSEGLFEVVTSRLSQLETPGDSVWVVPSADVRERGIRSVEHARDAFGVGLAVTGSTHWTEDSVRLSLNLIDAISLRQISSQFIDRAVADVGALPDDAAMSVARMIEVRREASGYIRRLAEVMGLMPSGARRLFREETSAAPGAVEFFVTARGYLNEYDRTEDIDTAIDLLQRATASDPEFALAHAALGQAFWRKYELTGDQQYIEPAAAHCDTAAAVGADLASVHVAVGTVQHGVGRYEDARASLARALEIDGANAEAHRELAKLYDTLSALQNSETSRRRAEEHFKRARSLRPDYWAAYRDLGVFYFQSGRFEEATVQFERALSLAPRNPRTYGVLGAAYQLLGQFEKAQETFETALQYDPDSRTYSNLGAVYFHRRLYARAAEYYRKAIDENDTDYWYWAGLAESLYWSDSLRADAGQAFERAIQLGEQARSVNPRDYHTTAYLATLYAYQGEMDRARRLISEALEAVPDDGQLLSHAAEVYALAGNDDRADAYVDRAVANGFPPYYIENSPLLGPSIPDDGAELPLPR